MTELETNAVFSDANGVIWVVGRRGGDQFIYALPVPDRVFECPFEVVDSCTVGATTYLLPNDQAPVPSCLEIVAGTEAAVWMPPKRRVPVQRLRL